LSGTHWMTYYESMRTEELSNGCPGAANKNGQCYLNNMLTESRLGVNAGVHTYLHHVNASDPTTPVEDQTPHIAAFMVRVIHRIHLYIMHYTLYTCTLYTIYFTLYTVHYILYTVYYTLCRDCIISIYRRFLWIGLYTLYHICVPLL
jgi:hypothetical protein